VTKTRSLTKTVVIGGFFYWGSLLGPLRIPFPLPHETLPPNPILAFSVGFIKALLEHKLHPLMRLTECL